MTAETAIASGLATLWLRIPWVMWLTLLILLLADRRQCVTVCWIVLSATCAACSLRNWAESAEDLSSHLWLASMLAAVAATLGGMHNWLRKSETIRLQPTFSIAIVGCLVAAYASVQILLDDARLTGVQHTLAVMHLLAAGVGLATSLVGGCELTFLSSPSSLADAPPQRVRWRFVTWCGLAALLTESAIGLFVLTASLKSTDAEPSLGPLLINVFFFSLLATHFVAWMVPYRISGYQRREVFAKSSAQVDSSKQIRDWASLAMAAWLAAISLAVACGLPSDWPWRACFT